MIPLQNTPLLSALPAEEYANLLPLPPSPTEPMPQSGSPVALFPENLAVLPPLPPSPTDMPQSRLFPHCSNPQFLPRRPQMPFPPPPLPVDCTSPKCPTASHEDPRAPLFLSPPSAEALPALTKAALCSARTAHQVAALTNVGIAPSQMRLSASGNYVVVHKHKTLGQFTRDGATGSITYTDDNPLFAFFINNFLEEFPIEHTLEEFLFDATIWPTQPVLRRLQQENPLKYSEFIHKITREALDSANQAIKPSLISVTLPIVYYRVINNLLNFLCAPDMPENIRHLYCAFASELRDKLFPQVQASAACLVSAFLNNTPTPPLCSLFQDTTIALEQARESINDIICFERTPSNRVFLQEFRNWRAEKAKESIEACDVWMERLHDKAMREFQSYQCPATQNLLSLHPDCLLAIAHHNLLIDIRTKQPIAQTTEHPQPRKQKQRCAARSSKTTLSAEEITALTDAALSSTADTQSDAFGAPKQKKAVASSSASASASAPTISPNLALVQDIIRTDRSPCKFRFDPRVSRWNKPGLSPTEVSDPTNHIFFDTVPAAGAATPQRSNQYAGLPEAAIKRAICLHAFPCADILVSSPSVKQKYGQRYVYSAPFTNRTHCGWTFTGELHCEEGIIPGTLRIAINPSVNIIYHVEFTPHTSSPPTAAAAAATTLPAAMESASDWQTASPYNATIDDDGVLSFSLPDGRKLFLHPKLQ